MSTTRDLAELRDSISAGSYVVDAEQVAHILALKIAVAERVRRALSLNRDGRNPAVDGYHRPGRAAPRRRPGSPHR